MKYLPDTHVWIDYISGQYPALAERILATPPDDLRLSSIVVAELRYAADRGPQKARNHGRIDLLVREVPNALFDMEAAMVYGRLRCMLSRQDVVLGPNDLLIAAQTIALGCVLVSDRETFGQIRSLEVESWRQPPETTSAEETP